MWKYLSFSILLCYSFVIETNGECSAMANATVGEYMLFDFTKISSVSDWAELSNKITSTERSKASMTLVKDCTQRVVLRTNLVPSASGVAFAGVRRLGLYNVSGQKKLQLYCRGQGEYKGYKIVLRHKCLNNVRDLAYIQFFEVPQNDFAVVTLPFEDFKPYLGGLEVTSDVALDLSQISSIGIQAYGGVNRSVKQKGSASVDIEWIKAIP